MRMHNPPHPGEVLRSLSGAARLDGQRCGQGAGRQPQDAVGDRQRACGNQSRDGCAPFPWPSTPRLKAGSISRSSMISGGRRRSALRFESSGSRLHSQRTDRAGQATLAAAYRLLREIEQRQQSFVPPRRWGKPALLGDPESPRLTPSSAARRTSRTRACQNRIACIPDGDQLPTV